MTVDPDLDVRRRIERVADLVEHLEALGIDVPLVELEVDLVRQLDLAVVDDEDIRAAVLVAVAVEVLGVVAAVPFDAVLRHPVVVGPGVGAVRVAVQLRRVEHLVAVVVDVRATILVLELVEVLGVVRALVDAVEQRVAVVVWIGAAVLVFPLVDVLGLVAAVDLSTVLRLLVEVDPLAVRIERGRVEDPVLVVVLVRAAVVVLEAVEVLGVIRALVDAVVVAVAVAVTDRRGVVTDHVRVLAADRVSLLAGQRRVQVGLLRVLLAAVVLAHGQRVAGEADVRLGDRRLLGRAADGLRTVGDRLLKDLVVTVHLAVQGLPGAGQARRRHSHHGEHRTSTPIHLPPPTETPALTSPPPALPVALASPAAAPSATG